MVENIDALPLQDASDEGRLAALGLTADDLLRAARVGLAARASRTAFAPRNALGTDLYSHTVEALRMGLSPRSWTAECVGGQERAVSPDGATAIVVATGDGDVGVQAMATPWTAHPKGRLMRQAVATNQEWIQEGWAFPELAGGGYTRLEADGPLVWILLLKVEGDLLHLELSLPDHITEEGRVQSWAQRIALPSLAIDGELDIKPRDEGPGIDVPVARR